MSRLRSVLAALLIAMLPSVAVGFNEQVTVGAGSSGQALITLSGAVNACYTHGTTTFSVIGTTILVTTAVQANPCFPTPPFAGYYAITVDVGTLAPGRYNVVWSLGPPYNNASWAASFDFPLQENAIPVMTVPGLGLLAALVAGFAATGFLRH